MQEQGRTKEVDGKKQKCAKACGGGEGDKNKQRNDKNKNEQNKAGMKNEQGWTMEIRRNKNEQKQVGKEARERKAEEHHEMEGEKNKHD